MPVVASPQVEVEVLVVGAGPVGSALTLLLRHEGVDTVLVDRATFPRDKPCGEGLLPSGVAVLRSAGIDLGELGFPPLRGVRYRLPGFGWCRGTFAGPAFGVRRLRLDALLSTAASASTGISVRELRRIPGGWCVQTDRGAVTANAVVATDGMRSSIRRQVGWERTAAAAAERPLLRKRHHPPRRYGLVGHLHAPGHDRQEIVVTLLGDVETYLAPASTDEILLAVLGPRGSLRAPARSVFDSYRSFVSRAHPELAGCALAGKVCGAGPFGVRPTRVAADGLFLCGDASGFLDPLTGDALAAGLVQASVLATLLRDDPSRAAERYRRFWTEQWRRRCGVSHLALRLTRYPGLARRALRGAARRPAALDRLLLASDGRHGLRALGVRDWAALAGWAG
jgi:flavin-dependent dehydrogenase